MLRWIKRIVFGLVAVVALAIVGGIVFVSTDYGREKMRAQIQDQLNNVFAGGATVGSVEGTPFGELVLRKVVIKGPDDKPAIMVGTLRVRVHLVDLFKHDVRIRELLAEDVDIQLRRDSAGRLQVGQLLKRKVQAVDPPPPPSKSNWNIDLPAIELRRAHVMIDTGLDDFQVVNLDALHATGSAHLPADGRRTASLQLGATWRERSGAAISIDTSVVDTVEMLSAPKLAISVGGVQLAASNLEVVFRANQLPLFGGTVHLTAPAVAVAQIMPAILFPADVVMALTATRGEISAIGLAGTIGPTPIKLDVVADLDRKHATGKLVTGDLELTALTRGKVNAVAGVTIDFDAMPGAPGMLPTATAAITGHGTYQNLPRADFTASLATHGQRIATKIDLTGAQTATIVADVRRTAESLSLASGSIVGVVLDPATATGGRAPVHGKLALDLTLHGALTPVPDLAVAGTITGGHLRVQDLSVASAKVVVDATGLPYHPQGKASVALVELVRGTMELGALTVAASTRPDKRVAIDVQSHPKQDPWLFEVGALLTLPTADGTMVVDILRHRVRAGDGVDWSGGTGHVVIGPERIDLQNFRSASAEGKVAASGSFGRKSGDIVAKIDLESFALGVLQKGYSGTVGAHIDAARRGGQWTGAVDVAAAGLAVSPDKPAIDLVAKLVAAPGTVTVDATATSKGIGGVKLALDLSPPRRIEDVAAWKARGRIAIRSAQLTLQDVDLGKLGALAHQQVAGHLDGAIAVTPTSVSGALHVRTLQSPALHGVRFVDADLDLGQSHGDELDPQLTVVFADVGKLVAKAQIGMPKDLLDPKAWTIASLRGAQIDTGKIIIDPGFFDRLKITSSLRGTASFHAEVGPGAKTLSVAGDFLNVRGTPIAQPVDIKLVAGSEGKALTIQLAMTTISNKQPMTLLKLDGRLPVTLDELRTNPAGMKTAPLQATLELPKTSLPALMNVFGRKEITAGTADGKIELTGTIARPAMKGRIVADDIEIPPGPRGKPIQKVKQLALDLAWDPDKGGTVSLDGTEDGGGTLAIRAQGNLSDLANGTATVKSTKFDFSPLLAFAPGPAGGSKGTLDANFSVKGFDLRTAQLAGELHMKNARIPIAPAVGTLREANIDIAIHEHDIGLEVTGKLGAGDVKMQGSIALDGASLTGGDATLTLRKVSPIGSVQPVIDADVKAKLAHKDGTWTADIIVDKGFAVVSTKAGEKLKPVGPPKDLFVGRGKRPVEKGTAQPPDRPIFIATITLHDMKVESDEFRTTLRGELTATADAATVGMVGHIEALGGDLDLFSRRYRIETAAVQFDGTLDPMVQVRITHDFPDVETITEVRGRLSNPQLVLSSDPGTYSDSELLGFLLGGEPGGDPSSGSARNKATSAGASFIAGQIGGYIKKALPFDIDVIKYEAASTDSSAAITVGSWITHTLFLAFTEHLAPLPTENTSEAVVDYWLTKRLEVEGTVGDRSVDGVDLLWRKRF